MNHTYFIELILTLTSPLELDAKKLWDELKIPIESEVFNFKHFQPILESSVAITNVKKALSELLYKRPEISASLQPIYGFFTLPTESKISVETKALSPSIYSLLQRHMHHEFQQGIKRSIPAYLHRMAKACGQQFNPAFNWQDVQTILDNALWQRRDQYDLTTIHYAELQNHLVDAADLLKKALWEEKLGYSETLKRLSTCLTKVIDHYLKQQKNIRTLVATATQNPLPIALITHHLPEDKKLEGFAHTFIFVTKSESSPESGCYYIAQEGHKQALCSTLEDHTALTRLLENTTLAKKSKITGPVPLQSQTAKDDFSKFLKFATERVSKLNQNATPSLSVYDQDLRQALVSSLAWRLRYTSEEKFNQEIIKEIQLKLAQCRWAPATDKFLHTTSMLKKPIHKLQLVYYEWADSAKTTLRKKVIFPDNNKALKEFIFANFPVKITEEEFENFLKQPISNPVGATSTEQIKNKKRKELENPPDSHPVSLSLHPS